MLTPAIKQAAILTTCGEVTNEATGETSKVWGLINRAKRRSVGWLLNIWDAMVSMLRRVPGFVWVLLGVFFISMLVTVLYYLIFFALFIINPVLAYVFEVIWVVGWLGALIAFAS